MTPANLKNLMAILLIGTGILHLAVAALMAPADIRLPIGVFGLIYAGLGYWVRTGTRNSVLAATVVTATGLGLGGSSFLQNGGPSAMIAMFLIDAVIIAAGLLWIMKARKAS